MEDSGRCRRGYVVEGLGAAQFAVPGAIDRLRAVSQATEGSTATVVLAATDPAQPYGAALPWPPTVGDVRHRPGRKAGALAVLVDGAAVLYVERGGRSLLSFTEDTAALRAAVGALAKAVQQGWLGSLSVERADGEAALGSALASLLRDAGFRATPRGLRLRA
jgi:ATP-dependent Lhr-like helicase